MAAPAARARMAKRMGGSVAADSPVGARFSIRDRVRRKPFNHRASAGECCWSVPHLIPQRRERVTAPTNCVHSIDEHPVCAR